MTKVEILRNNLHSIIDKGDYSEILKLSQRLDREILKIVKRDMRNFQINKNSINVSP